MTFIASVIAKEGVAIVADSFVTSIEYSIDAKTFAEHIKKRKSNNIPFTKLISLFKEKPSHTRNYVDKLFEFDQWTAITTTGQAYINKKEIGKIITDVSCKIKKESNYDTMNIQHKIEYLIESLKAEIREHLKTKNISATDFIVSHFDPVEDKSKVFIITVEDIDKDNYTPSNIPITWDDRTYLKIIADGQDFFVDRLIFGSLYKNITKVKNEFLDHTLKTLKPKKEKREAFSSMVKDIRFLEPIITEDLFAVKLRELSLQEAVDLASLLIKIVMDIQVYTEKIPTVGGLIKLAVIKRGKGFEWISGDGIKAPKIIS